MRRRCLFWVVSWLAIGMSACTTLKPPRQPQGLETAKACTDWRWIGISRHGARCPEIRGWTVQALFPQLAPASRKSDDYCATKEGDYCKERESEKVPSSELIQELNRFCVYEPADPKKGTKDLPFPLSASADLVKLDQDCASISSTDRELDPNDWKADHMDFIPREPETPLKIDKAGVRLAFLDTQPTEEVIPKTSGNSPHGFTLVHLARQLLCAPGSYTHCAAHITTQLALPIVKFDPKTFKNNEIDPKRGGYLGMPSDLAQAIRDEVDSWRSANAQQHLVLNLSVAWDGNLFGGLSEEQIDEMRAGTQAVYYALQYAASFDVLVLAAAGNQKIEPCANFGPLLPAAWEKTVPEGGRCPREPQKTPLLYAVGGVQHDGLRLTNARPGGMPQRAAYGETAVLLSVDPETVYNKKIYSGSSIATAYASSIAAAVWSASPELDSHGVMNRLYEKGHPLNFNADFWFDDVVQPAARLLSLCTALKLPCAPFRLGAASPRPTGFEISSR
ncbi:MAG TPA: S8/S53 family peptidase, partial [Thermoanaerobaculia bacterium]|nr:S8/S53 family peptidase [Thermoanaerobaculia bacterium]